MVRLTAEQKKFYKDNGYILVKNLLTEKELNQICVEYDKLFQRKNPALIENSWVGKNLSNRVTDSPYTVKGIHNLQLHHAVFGKLLCHDNIVDVLEDIMGTENIMLHHTKAHIKPPEKGAAYPMHQDYHYFPYEKHTPVAMFLHLDAANPENGGLCVYPGSHKLGPQEDVGSKVDDYHYLDKTKFPFEGSTPVVADRGDIVFFSYLTVHGSPLNTSNRTRRMFLAQFVAAEDKTVGIQAKQPGYGWMMRGVNVGKNASTESRLEYD